MSSYMRLKLFLSGADGAPGIKEILSEINEPDEFGRTPLCLACLDGDEKVVEWLLDHGANIEPRDLRGNTAMVFAIANDHLGCAKLLVDAGASLNPINIRGESLLALVAGTYSFDALRFLVESGVSVDRSGGGNMSPLFAAVKNSRYAQAEYLLKHGADPNALPDPSSGAQSLIEIAASRQDVDMMELLLIHGADPCQQCFNGAESLHISASANNPEAIEILVRYGADINGINFADRTPLIEAAASAKYEAALKLLELGADPDIRGMADKSALHMAVHAKDARCSRLLCSKMSTPDLVDSNDLTPLYYAVTSGLVDVVDVLLDAGADALREDGLDGSSSPIYAALAERQDDVLALIISRGLVDPDCFVCDPEEGVTLAAKIREDEWPASFRAYESSKLKSLKTRDRSDEPSVGI